MLRGVRPDDLQTFTDDLCELPKVQPQTVTRDSTLLGQRLKCFKTSGVSLTV